MSDRRYLLETPPPGPMKQYFNQTVVPAMINAAGAVEVAAEQVAVRVRRRPMTGVGMALGIGCALGVLAGTRRSET